MTDRQTYLGDLASARALLMGESRSIVGILLRQPSDDEWKRAVTSENILQQKSPVTAVRIANLLRKRLEPLGEQFLKAVESADDQLLRQLLMVAVMLRSPVVEDFMRTVLLDAVRRYQTSISKADWAQFYQDRAKTIPVLAELSDKTVNLAGRNLMTILADGGYLDSGLKKNIQTVYLLPATKRWLIELGKEQWMNTMECKV
ncbi:MAG: DUF1819 family protein [Gammaproteobacteria bacterium]|nr:DUF1819 family protein [Gammaproteobacteria bacterium]MBT7479605.1 DUF1819 family protein [Gammaproteobacteria bacterium]